MGNPRTALPGRGTGVIDESEKSHSPTCVFVTTLEDRRVLRGKTEGQDTGARPTFSDDLGPEPRTLEVVSENVL